MKILLFFLFSLISYTSDLKFNFFTSKIQSNRYWARIKLSIEGSSGNYDLTYTSLPKSWKQVKNFVYLPKKDLKKKRKYPCQVIVRD